jgi:hypothetical protein
LAFHSFNANFCSFQFIPPTLDKAISKYVEIPFLATINSFAAKLQQKIFKPRQVFQKQLK